MTAGVKAIIAGASLFVLGGFVVPLGIVLPLILSDSGARQFVVPGITEVMAEKPGRYYLWNDYRTVFEGRSYTRSETIPDGFEIRIRDGETGEAFDLVSDASISSSRGRNARNSIGYVEVQSPGRVTLEITGGSEERVFSFSRSRLLALLGLILAGFALSVTMGMSGVGLIIWGIVKRIRSSKEGEQGTVA